ncbi:hypothetical protein BC938DRAFT_474991 [Jimgerdemannia flammicorona]|uniref:Uncharacterized protein n=1 Tax=Jimgerdemannia flammicorona TaxID=994334 RepID=A0A433Q1G9_9FUNG|nr:hypothetical protein BC938DRAFT_474991 [Jimgerdemannia flammicorona]
MSVCASADMSLYLSLVTLFMVSRRRDARIPINSPRIYSATFLNISSVSLVTCSLGSTRLGSDADAGAGSIASLMELGGETEVVSSGGAADFSTTRVGFAADMMWLSGGRRENLPLSISRRPSCHHRAHSRR